MLPTPKMGRYTTIPRLDDASMTYPFPAYIPVCVTFINLPFVLNDQKIKSPGCSAEYATHKLLSTQYLACSAAVPAVKLDTPACR
jgi:hypothetical protein